MSLVLPPVKIGSTLFDWSRTFVLGVINVTPDSFSDGGLFFNPKDAIEHGIRLATQGADALDIGGESTRPGSQVVSAQEEMDRVCPVIEALVSRVATPISIDTLKASVAKEAIKHGATIINDISGMTLDPQMLHCAAATSASVILGHMRGTPAMMQQKISFVDVVKEVTNELRFSIQRAIEAGISVDKIWVDPGIGFGKTAEQSLSLLRNSGQIKEALGYPLMIGPSRKSFIGAVTGQLVNERLLGTCAAIVSGIIAGVDAVRIHDVGELMPAIKIADAIRRSAVSLASQIL